MIKMIRIIMAKMTRYLYDDCDVIITGVYIVDPIIDSTRNCIA